MDYPFENLSPEKFQLFCQALLAKENSGMQCFPVAQPDGGRDAAQVYYNFSGEKEFVMYQVKFVRTPSSINDPHKWITDIIGLEAPKVKKQIAKGASRFVLMTNVAGTAHPESGSIDLVNGILEREMGVPAICLWRNDLSRRLDGMWDLKWVYPELMTGPDLIRSLIENQLSEAKERRADAIRAFLAFQFDADENVKFRQVDLNNRLLDLFIDVPIKPGNGPRWLQGGQIRIRAGEPDFRRNFRHESDVEDEYNRRVKGNGIGAGTFLLKRLPDKDGDAFVIEGAPGQGKSTITQYVCQVHRMRLLRKESELELIPESHQKCPVRLPVKVDLRDFAAWLSRHNPFSAEAEEIPLQSWDKSLEGFLAALIRNQSGGAIFSVSDLHAVTRLSSVLIVLDGLDEVADIKKRGEVVTEIVKGVDRLHSVSGTLQVVVTSRPAAFENSPGMPEKKFRYLGLDFVTLELIDEYASKWLKARRLEERESSEVKRILKEKLSMPHIRDLARNPMQLAILLSLIHTRGVSLPDKRTALYDSYVELFFNRESEKSSIVRNNRDLLIDIHRYLAWLLHVEAERNAGAGNQATGSIPEKRLKLVLKSYLLSEGQNASIADELFTGMVERVVALVSRVQGTYEFEVQPLREYFAARYLHETAPYSPVGSERRGTRPDRFDAIARNFYWLNVTRFYAGCYSKGELASLIDRLEELMRDPDFKDLSHPRVLGATLLGDWVFTQHPKSVAEVVRMVLDGLGLRFLLASSSRRQARAQPLVLPESCGKAELIDRCITMLRTYPCMDYALDVIDIFQANAQHNEILPLWRFEMEAVSNDKRTLWLEYGLRLGCVHSLTCEELEYALSDQILDARRADILLRSKRTDVIQSNHDILVLIDSLLDRKVSGTSNGRKGGWIEAFSQVIDPSRYAVAFREPAPAPLGAVHRQYSGRDFLPIEIKELEKSASDYMVNLVIGPIRVAGGCEKTTAKIWATSLEPWETLTNELTGHFGNRPAIRLLANVASGIKSSAETCADYPDLHDDGKSVCRRARYARLRAGNPVWWRKQFDEAVAAEQKSFCCELYFTWASSKCISQTLPLVALIVSEFTEEEWWCLFKSVKKATDLTQIDPRDRSIPFGQVSCLNIITEARVLALLRIRMTFLSARSLYELWLAKSFCKDKQILEVFQEDAMEALVRSPKSAERHLKVLAAAYEAGVTSPDYAPYRYTRHDLGREIPLKIALQIVSQADRYPSFLVAAAEGRCRSEAAKRVRPVGDVAEAEGWFS